MNKIDKLRRQLNFTYKDIATKAGLTEAYICQLAKGKRNNPSKEVMESIAKALNSTVQKVFF